MDLENLTNQLACRFNQHEASVWVKTKAADYKCLARSSADLTHETKIREVEASAEQSFHVVGKHKVCFFGEYVLVFDGHRPIRDVEGLTSYLMEHRAWFDLLCTVASMKQSGQAHRLLMEVAHTISSSMHDEKLLDIIIESAISALPAADKGFLFLYDETSGKLLVKSAVGFTKAAYLKTQLSPGEAITGQVFQSGQPLLLNGEENIVKAMANMTKENRRHYLDAVDDVDYPDSIISAPLVYQEETIGVLMIDSFKKDEHFMAADLEVLQALANHVAVAIVHSELFEKEKSQRKKLQVIHNTLKHEHWRLQQTTDLHYRLSSIATQGRGLTSMVRAMYDTVQTSIGLFDTLLKPIAWAGDNAKLTLPNDFLKLPEVQKAMKTKKWQLTQSAEDEQLIVLPVYGTNHLLGFLCAEVTNDEEAEKNIFLLEYGTTILTLEWLKIEAVEETKKRMRGHLFDEILLGDINVQLIKQAKSLGLDAEAHYLVIAVNDRAGLSETPAVSHYGYEQERWYSYLNNKLERMGMQGFVVQKKREIVVIVSFQKNKTDFRRREIREKVEELFGFSDELFAGIGRMRKGLVYIGKSYKEAKQCLDLLKKSKSIGRRLLHFSEMGAYRFFLKHDPEDIKSFIDDLLGPIMRYDRKKNGELFQTLLAYVKHDKDNRKITSELNIHFNTLYYRMARVQEITGVDFAHSQDWFDIQLACQMYGYIREKEESEPNRPD
ncbi:MAG TPA: GAF domain-containing protein [Bacillales bacterium]|nr:GAF domain-containing protein [Bacillales bacterium]